MLNVVVLCRQAPPLFSAILNYRHSEGPGKAMKQQEATESEAQNPFGIEVMGGEERGNYPFDLSVDDLGEGFSLTAQIDASVDANQVLGYVVKVSRV